MRRSFGTAMAILFVLGMVVPRPAGAQTTAPGPYYATPSWDQTFPCTTTATCPRFVVLSNMGGQSVLDRETGLVWQRAPSQTFTVFQFAALDCLSIPFAGRGGWHLPTVSEISSLLESDSGVSFSGLLPAGHPFSVTPGFDRVFWTATAAAGVDLSFHSFWTVRLNSTGASYAVRSGAFDSPDKAFTWCVRGPQAN
jgi:hypothetical protein